MKVGDQIEVTIEKMSLQGGGLARYDGIVVFVEFSAPNDRLLVEITEIKKKHAFARILKVLKPSDERQSPPCPVFGRCGGCNWQHLKIKSQLSWKQNLVTEALERALQQQVPMLPIVQSPHHFRYRNRIQLKKDQQKIGYFEKSSHQLVEIDDCLLAEESLIPLMKELRQKQASGVQDVELALNASGTPQIRSRDQRDLGFSQVNRFVNTLLVREVLDWMEQTTWTHFWDLYAGAGNFTFPISEKFSNKTGIAVELSSASVQSARLEMKKRNWSPKKLDFFQSDVGLFLKRMTPSPETFVFLDPPRMGADETVIRSLAASSIHHLLYLSCDPMTLARDLNRFLTWSPQKWRVKRVRCFDMFPQTDHVETLVELEIDSSTSNVNV